MATLTGSDIGIDNTRRGMGSVWGWFIALGVVLILLGVLAFFNLPAATRVSVYAVGIFMLGGAGAPLARSRSSGTRLERIWPAAAERAILRCSGRSHSRQSEPSTSSSKARPRSRSASP